MKEFLDEVGGRYIVQRVKQMINAIEADYVTKAELQAELDALNIDIDLSAYATKEELTDALSNIDLSAYATKEYVTDAINNAQLGGDGSSVDLSIYAKKSDLNSKADTEHTHTMSDITDYKALDLSSYAKKTDIPSLDEYALKTEIPSIDGLATTEYVDNAIANIPTGDGGNVDLSNYYTKDETYSKTEIDTAISNIETGGGNISSDSCALYDTVVANGGAVKEIIETEKGIGTNLSEIISDVADGKEVDGDGNGHFYVRMNPDKTQEELNAEFNGVIDSDKYGRLDFILASSIKPEELFASNIKERLKNGEEIYYIFAHKVSNNYNFFYARVFYNKMASDNGNIGVADCYCTEIFQIVNNARFNIYAQMKNIKYLCSGTYENGGEPFYKDTGHFIKNSSYYPTNWKFFSRYLPTGTEYTYTTTIGGNTYSNTISENISSPEFSAYLLDTYLSNCNETIKIYEKVNYSLTEWGEKLDTQGEDGISPTVSITETDNGHTVSITDVNGTQSFDMTDGVSPTVTVTKEGKVATITCTDVNGTTTATISDGADGSGGGSFGGSTDVYSTEETAIGTWIDGSTIYRKVIEVGKLASVSSGNYDTVTTTFSDVACGELLRTTGIIKYGTTTRIVVDGGFSNLQLNPSTTHSTYINDVEKSRLTLIGSSTSIKLLYGKDFGGYNYTLVVEYTKSA